MEDVDSIVARCGDVPVIDELIWVAGCYNDSEDDEPCLDDYDYQIVECYKNEAGIDLMDPFYSDNAVNLGPLVDRDMADFGELRWSDEFSDPNFSAVDTCGEELLPFTDSIKLEECYDTNFENAAECKPLFLRSRCYEILALY